jgi:hypothetical protein
MCCLDDIKELQMNRTQLSALIFSISVFLLFVHSTFPLLWGVAGIPVPYPLMTSGAWAALMGFTPVLGLIGMLAAGLIYGSQDRKVKQ